MTTSKQIKSNDNTYNHYEESEAQGYHQNGSYNNWIVELYLSYDNQAMICPWKKIFKTLNLNNLLKELSSPQNSIVTDLVTNTTNISFLATKTSGLVP